MKTLNSIASSLIEELYEEEAMLNEPVEEPVPFHKRKMSLRAQITTVFMFDAIAARFGKTRVDLIEPALDLYAEQLFLSLSEADRESIAADVDAICTENLPEGLEFQCANPAGSFKNECAHWRGLAATIKHFQDK